MGLYLTHFAYTPEAWAALAKQPQDRAEAFRGLVERHGGRFHQLYYCFGEWDGVTIYEAPDDTTAAAIAVSAVSPGHLKAISTTPLLTMEQALNALRKAGGQTFQGPS
jgi:uncharacterized protein with GYD domain